jgi:predicted RNA-binding protein YlxR (DUF448 family)
MISKMKLEKPDILFRHIIFSEKKLTLSDHISVQASASRSCYVCGMMQECSISERRKSRMQRVKYSVFEHFWRIIWES